MSKSNVWEDGLLDLVFTNITFTLLGTAAGILKSATDGSMYFSLHTSDPSETGDQETNEITTGEYAGYLRVGVARSTSGFTVTSGSVSPDAAITFPAGTGGTGATATHMGVGTDLSGAGKRLYSGTITPNIVCGDGVTPELTTATAITEA